jgi:hypothetical protein
MYLLLPSWKRSLIYPNERDSKYFWENNKILPNNTALHHKGRHILKCTNINMSAGEIYNQYIGTTIELFS